MRINIIRNELTKLENELLGMVKKNKDDYFKIPNESLKSRKDSSIKLIELTENYLLQEKYSNFMLKAYANKCYCFINDIKILKSEYDKNLKNLKFVSSKWLPTKLEVGFLKIPNFHYSNRDSLIISNEIANVNFYLKPENQNILPKIMFQNRLPFNKSNYVLNEKEFTVMNDISKISEETEGGNLCEKFGICYDSIENIYLCDFRKDSVLIVDKEFKKIKKIESKPSHDENEAKNIKINRVKPLNVRFVQTIFI